ncbi:MAG: nitrous oxide reductase family maturation protein NosD [Phycisphaerales bacterium]
MNRRLHILLALIPAAALAASTRAARPADHAGEISRRLAAAQPGATIEIGPGVYHERLRLDKPVTLIGIGRPIIDGDNGGDIIEITAPGVTFRGFTVRNTGIDLDNENAAVRVLAPRATIEDNILIDVLFGIDLREAPDSAVRANRIGGKNLDIARRGDGLRLWRSDRAIIEDNVFHDGRDAILWYSTGVTVRRNTARDCRYGLHLMYSDDVRIEGNDLTGNSVGLYLMYSKGIQIVGNRFIRNRGPSGYGIGLKEADQFCVRDNLITGNRAGIYIDGSPFTRAMPGVFTRNTIAYNDAGFIFLPSARNNEIYDNNFIDNIDQVSVAGRGDLSANQFWKGERGNFWSDYTGYDQDADGIGDFVHESQTLFDNIMDKEPRTRLFLFSPAQQAIEFVGRALPAVRPEPKFTDEVPLMRPVAVEASGAAPRGSAARLGAVAAGLLALGAGIVTLGRGAIRGAPPVRHGGDA